MILLSTFTGCVTPTTDFDTVKVVVTVTRNGGDYTLNPTGESGYQMHAVVGTLSIEALGLDIDTQAMVNTYKQLLQITNNTMKICMVVE